MERRNLADTQTTKPQHCIGVLLAGGRSSRMGEQDKAFCQLGQQTLIATVINKIAPQVDGLVINTNSDNEAYRVLGLPVVKDCVAGYLGPLVGILSALDWIHEHRPQCQWLASFSVDTPFITPDVVATLFAAVRREKTLLATVRSGQRSHPVIGLWSLQLRDDLREQLLRQQLRKVDKWTQRHGIAIADFDTNPVDPFFNINSPADLETARKMAELE